jgi:hypothetical protein
VAVAITMGEARFRAPADVPILMLAAVGADACISRRFSTGASRDIVRTGV